MSNVFTKPSHLTGGPREAGLGETFYQVAEPNSASVKFIQLSFPDTLNDIPQGAPLTWDEYFEASLATAADEIMGYAFTRIPCSKLASDEVYVCGVAVEGMVPVAVYSADVDGGATTFDGEPLAIGAADSILNTGAVTLTGTNIAVVSITGVATGTGTAFDDELKVGDWVKITDADETLIAQVISIASATSMQLSRGPYTDIATSTAEEKLILPANAVAIGKGDTFLGDKFRISGTGTCAATATTLAGTGTAFDEEVSVGDIVVATLSDGTEAAALVSAVASATSLTIAAAFSATLAVDTSAPLYVKSNLVKAWVK